MKQFKRRGSNTLWNLVSIGQNGSVFKPIVLEKDDGTGYRINISENDFESFTRADR